MQRWFWTHGKVFFSSSNIHWNRPHRHPLRCSRELLICNTLEIYIYTPKLLMHSTLEIYIHTLKLSDNSWTSYVYFSLYCIHCPLISWRHRLTFCILFCSWPIQKAFFLDCWALINILHIVLFQLIQNALILLVFCELWSNLFVCKNGKNVCNWPVILD